MRILIVSLFPLELNSSVAISTKSIISGFLDLGYNITIIMPMSSDGTITPSMNKVDIIRINGVLKKMSNIYLVNKFRARVQISDYRVHHLLKEARNISIPNVFFDYVLSVSDPVDSHLFAKNLIKRGLRYGKWIQHWGDPLYGNISHRLIWPKSIIRKYENSLFKYTDKIIYVTPFTAREQQDIHKKDHFNIKFIPLPCDVKSKRGTHSQTEIINIAYIGDYNPKIRNIRPLYEACKNKKNISLTVAGYGVPLELADNITLYHRVSHNKAKELESEADVIVGICNLYGTQIPGKFFYLANTDKHILVILEDSNYEAMKEYFDSYERFVVCRNTSPSILDAINKLRAQDITYKTPRRLIPSINASKIIEIG